jgi:hypothetical protein
MGEMVANEASEAGTLHAERPDAGIVFRNKKSEALDTGNFQLLRRW